jgi:DNA-binding CsgD family transcriptional regulator
VSSAAVAARTQTRHGCPLSPRELEAIQGIGEGLNYQQIADLTGRSPSTIRTQLSTAYQKLGVSEGSQAVLACVREGWIEVEGLSSSVDRALARVEQLLCQLVEAIEKRNETQPLTQAQRAYLASFESYLRSPNSTLAEQRRDAMLGRLRFVLREANLAYP